jgi:ribonuclease P protein component
MPPQPPILAQKLQRAKFTELWLRKHADYQRVYREGKRQSLPLMTYFFAAGPAVPFPELALQAVPQLRSRVGLTAGKVLGNAVERNRIKRRMREAVRRHSSELAANVDVILHPRRQVLEAEFSQIERDVQRAFQAIGTAMETHDGGSNRP